MKKMYVVTVVIGHPDFPEEFSYHPPVVAENEQDAIDQVSELKAEVEFLKNIQGCVVKHASATEVAREIVEQAAIEVLGWRPPFG